MSCVIKMKTGTKRIKNRNNKKTKAGGLVMKTKNNVQKTILKSVAVITSLVLISLNVNAQYYWKSLPENYNFNENDLALLDNTVETTERADVNVFASFLEQESEETLELEDWMINEALFNGNSIDAKVETEEALELETWMSDENYFESSVYQVMEETETELKIEGWMLNENSFEGAKETEQPLELEAWMISEEVW